MKFSIRDLLLLTVIVALTLGWWLDHRRSANELAVEREFRSKLEEVRPTYGQEGYIRLWGEPERHPIGEY